jgi:hypothetical protein
VVPSKMLLVAVVVPANQTAAWRRQQRLIPHVRRALLSRLSIHSVGLPGMGDVESATSPQVAGAF